MQRPMHSPHMKSSGPATMALACQDGLPQNEQDRDDSADYLGVSVETVSRSLSYLKHCGAIRLQGPRTASILDRDVLEEQEDYKHRRHVRPSTASRNYLADDFNAIRASDPTKIFEN